MNDSQSGEIFIVDDDPLIVNALTAVLSREGYQVSGFGEGKSFLAAAKSRTPTCVILDVQMPGQSGLDILKELNAQHYPGICTSRMTQVGVRDLAAARNDLPSPKPLT